MHIRLLPTRPTDGLADMNCLEMEMTEMKNTDHKEIYKFPEITVVEFVIDDVLTVSGGGPGIALPDDGLEG